MLGRGSLIEPAAELGDALWVVRRIGGRKSHPGFHRVLVVAHNLGTNCRGNKAGCRSISVER